MKITVTDRAGGQREIGGVAGLSLMETIRDHGYDELLALCGGSCACATCHVYVDPAALPSLPTMSADEDELLDATAHRTDCSRLSCQIVLSADLPELSVTIAPED